MTQHTVFGSGTPAYSLAVFTDGAPSIMLGNYFYTYGALATGWYCTGGRVYIPNDANVTNKPIQIKVWTTTTTGAPIDLSTAPIESVSTTTPAGAGWVEVEWASPITLNSGDMMFVGYQFDSPANVNYLYAASPNNSYVRSADDVDLVLAEASLATTSPATARGQYRYGTDPTGSSSAWYGTDVIISDTTTPAPVAEYGFNETSGTTAADSSGNGHDITVSDPTNFAVGRTGNGLHQLGGGDPNKITVLAPWYTGAERTMMFWARRGSEGGNTWAKTVHQDDAGASTVFGIFVNDDANNAYFRVRAGGVNYNITTPEISIGTWAHYALTHDGTTMTAYIDGVQVDQVSAPGSITASDNDSFMIYGDDYQMEVIDDLRLFNAALVATDIQYYKDLTIEPPDTTPPSEPTNVTPTVNYQSVVLDWDDATDNIAVQNYIVYRSATSGFTPAPGDQVGGPAVSNYSESAPVGTWYYRVSARDEAGNESTASPEVEVTTTSAPDHYFPSGLGWSTGTEYIDDSFYSGGVSLGHLFAMSIVDYIVGARFYSPEPQTGLTVTLYENGSQVAQKTGLDVTTGWNLLEFDTSYLAATGQDYTISIYIPGPSPSYTVLSGASWPSAGTISVGPMYTGLSNDGRLGAGSGIPSTSTVDWYGVDAVTLKNNGYTFDPTFGATVAEENAKPGAPSGQWAIGGAGDTTNLGFAREFSVNVGDTIEFSCHGDGTNIDIYRIGNYGGNGWRKVDEVENVATSQPDPNTIADSNGAVECSNWSVTASWDVPATALSGLFVGVYRNAATNNASYIPFIVRDDARTADIAYKTSDTTWALAYNYYGTPSTPLTGKSVYGSGGPMGDITTRAHATSYLRPIVTREGIPQTYWLACEAPMIRYIEANGLDVKYVASRDVNLGVSVLDNTKFMISCGHDEYWSIDMRDNVETYRDSGKHVLFFSGNEVFWRTRFTDANTMWCYKDTMDGPASHVGGTPLDPVTWTGTWKDTRFVGRKPENTITGTDFRMNGVNDRSVTFEQAGSYASHPFWRDTTIGSGNITVSGIIGFEADELAPTQPVGSYEVLANWPINIDGSRADDNGQSYSGNGTLNWGVVSQRYASGAVVVGFGTCQWSWGLYETHDRGGNYANANMQQATLNLFVDLGATPATPLAWLVAPTAVSSLDVYGAIPSSGRSGKVKVWDGAAWNAHPAKVWDGGAWVTRKAKGYDGSSWIDGKG